MTKVAKVNKYDYLHVIQQRTAYGWEDVTAAADLREARGYLRDYRQADPSGEYRRIFRREPNPAYGKR